MTLASRRQFIHSLAALAATPVLPAMAQAPAGAWPQRPIELIVPFAAGGGTDVLARALAEVARKHLPQDLIVLNRAGASGAVGWTELANARPDGYKIGIITVELTMIPHMGLTKISSDALLPVARLNADPATIAVRADSPYRSIEELIAAARKDEAAVRIGNAGPGSLGHLAAAALQDKADAWAGVVKSGRTHLMDATPVTLGQEFGGYAAAVRYGVERLQAALPRTAEVPLGGTAVGTGINTPAGFPQRVIELLREDTGLPLTEARDHFEAQSSRDGLVELSGALRTIAVSLTKICNDLRWMGSGPNTGLGEIAIPDLQPGSSIMPGKVNPVIPEAVLMVAARVVGNDATVAWAGASGSFELNVQIPVIASAVLESIRLLANASRVLADKTVAGLVANEERARAFAESSPSIVTPLNRVIGYEAAAKIAKHAVKHGQTIRQAVVDLGYVERGEVTEEQLDAALDVLSMTRPPQA